MSVIMAKGKISTLVKQPDGWAVKRRQQQGDQGHPHPAQAIEKAENIARNQKSDTKIHGEKGKIRAADSYGNDPCPPKDKSKETAWVSHSEY